MTINDIIDDAQNHTHEWKVTWGLAWTDIRPDGPSSIWRRYRHTGKRSIGKVPGIVGQKDWLKRRVAWQKKWLRSLSLSSLQYLKAIEQFGNTKAVWCF